MKTAIVIKDARITVNPIHNYRTTKGGKRIMTSNPGYALDVRLEIHTCNNLRHLDAVILGGVVFQAWKDQDKWFLVNRSFHQYTPFDFQTGVNIEVCVTGRMFGEGSMV